MVQSSSCDMNHRQILRFDLGHERSKLRNLISISIVHARLDLQNISHWINWLKTDFSISWIFNWQKTDWRTSGLRKNKEETENRTGTDLLLEVYDVKWRITIDLKRFICFTIHKYCSYWFLLPLLCSHTVQCSVWGIQYSKQHVFSML